MSRQEDGRARPAGRFGAVGGVGPLGGRPGSRRGLRREAPVLLPVSLLLFAALAAVTLLSYRSAITRLTAERQTWALHQALALAERASSPGEPLQETLQPAIPADVAVAVHDARGGVRWSFGFPGPERLDRPVPLGSAIAAPYVSGPNAIESGDSNRDSADVVAAYAPFAPPSARAERWLLRLELLEPALAAEQRSLQILTPVVFGLSVAVAILAIVFFRALTRPIEQLLERARESPIAAEVGIGEGAGRSGGRRGDDDLDFLLATFDRALAALRSSDADPTGATRRDAEARLADSVAQLGEMAAGIAHELRNSLGTLKGYLGLLARRELPAPAREELDEAQREAAALSRVVDDFLTFARPGIRKLDRLDLGLLIEHAIVDPSLAAATFRKTLPQTRVEIAGDERLLQRALRNLLLNAVEAHAEGGTTQAIDVVLAVVGETARISIRDCGPGIAPEVAAKLFVPFASGRPAGAGLGLALARRIVLLHEGSLVVGNRPEGGVLAELELPLGNSATEGSAATSSTPAPPT